MNTNTHTRPDLAERLRFLLGTSFYLGLSPILPGSCAALAAVAIEWAVLWHAPEAWRWPLLALAFAFFALATVRLHSWSIDRFGTCDHCNFTTDEVAGALLVPLCYPMGPHAGEMWAGYALFRVLDMIKIYPANLIDRRMKTGLGVLLDDVVSAVYAAVCLWAWRLLA